MRAGRKAGHSDIADHLLLAHLLSDGETARELRQVHVRRRPGVRMLEDYRITSAAARTDEGDAPRRRCPYRRAGGRRVVDAEVSALGVQDRMEAVTIEGRRHAHVLERSFEQRLDDALAVLGVIAARRAITRLEPKGAEGAR